MSSLLTLPGEIRNLIYAHIFTSDSPILVHKASPGRVMPRWKNQIRIPGARLLLTCRQVYRKARILPFALNAFSFLSTKVFEQLHERLIPEQRGAIRELEIQTGWGYLERREAQWGLDRMRKDGIALCALLPGVQRVAFSIRYAECRMGNCGCELGDAMRMGKNMADCASGDGTNGGVVCVHVVER